MNELLQSRLPQIKALFKKYNVDMRNKVIHAYDSIDDVTVLGSDYKRFINFR